MAFALDSFYNLWLMFTLFSILSLNFYVLKTPVAPNLSESLCIRLLNKFYLLKEKN